jgi:hypothetical protein
MKYKKVIVVYNNKENVNKLSRQNAEVFMLNHIRWYSNECCEQLIEINRRIHFGEGCKWQFSPEQHTETYKPKNHGENNFFSVSADVERKE